MKRRALLNFAATAAAFVLAGDWAVSVSAGDGRERVRFADLNPDRMWPIYRRYHLLIVGQRDDQEGIAFAIAAADLLARFLPDSRAQAVRAADTRRVGVLIATVQQDLAVMAKESAEALFLGRPPFVDIGGSPLRALVSFGSYLLVCRPDFLARHAYLVTKTLAEHEEALAAAVAQPDGVVPVHPGSRAFFRGEGMPNG